MSTPASQTTLPDFDRSWSRMVTAPDHTGVHRTWHVLDTGAAARRDGGTLVCVHGNPTWSYLWRRVLQRTPTGWRVIALDQLGMGYSERTGHPRRLAERIEDLDSVLGALGIDGPVSLAVHDWGGPVGLGWAGRHPRRVRSLVLTNTAVHQPEQARVPVAIAGARSAPLLRTLCRTTPVFVRSATAVSRLTGRPLPAPVRAAFAAPYAKAEDRQAVLDFVADIPLETSHPSRPALTQVARDLQGLRAVPALALWGARDPVFSDRYLHDLLARLPQTQVHRFPDAAHLVLEDRPDAVDALWAFLTESAASGNGAGPRDAVSRAEDPGRPELPPRRIEVDPRAEGTAVVELGEHGPRVIDFADLRQRVARTAARLRAAGVRPGHRVSVLVPPGIDLTVVAYAVWSLGGVVVVADAGLGLRALGRALRSARPDHVVGIPRALAACAALRVPGARLGVRPLLDATEHPSGADEAGVGREPQQDLDADAAVLFTSGATGPPKGVVYTRRQLLAQVAAVRRTFDIGPGDAFVAAFAPFALYGPVLGIPSAAPEGALDARRLSASALARAVEAVDATLVFASPAALRAVVATADDVSDADRAVLAGPRLLMSAGAPVPVPVLRAVRALLTRARTLTPYGMTEALPVACTDPVELEDAGLAPQDGVCVGAPIPGVEVTVAPLAPDATASEALTDDPHVLGEVVVRAAHVKDRYDRLWATQLASASPAGWHRTGDVGHLDEAGRLWVEGRLVHVLTTPGGPLAPVGPEQRVETLADVDSAAVVGVGPAGTQQVVVVLVPSQPERPGRRVLADTDLADRVRSVAGVPVSAVLVRRNLPVDIRHRSKIDRTALATWATRTLDGRSRR